MSRAIYKDIGGGPRQHLKYANLRAPAQKNNFKSDVKIGIDGLTDGLIDRIIDCAIACLIGC